MTTKRDSSGEPGFCSHCGSILPLLSQVRNITCYTCKRVYGPEVLENMESFYTIHFNTFDKKVATSVKKDEESEEGPTVERKCPICGNDKMSFATLQLRSADEGQTVFYTCTKCKFKETENS